MRKNAARLWLVPTLAMALAGCGGKATDEVEPNIPPKDFKQEVLSTLSKTLDDPTNARDAYISDPVLTQVGSNQRYTVCVRFNARDLNKSYIGSKDRIAYFYGGHVNQLVEATKEQCGNAAYKPFPELEKYCFATKCG